jgi:hypothetical protein
MTRETLRNARALFLDCCAVRAVRSDSVPEKIKSAIAHTDMYFAIITGKRDHSWITAGTRYAIARNKFLFLLSKKVATFYEHWRVRMRAPSVLEAD